MRTANCCAISPFRFYANCFHFRAEKHKGFCAPPHSQPKFQFSVEVAGTTSFGLGFMLVLKIVTYPRKLEGNTRSKTSLWKSPKSLVSDCWFLRSSTSSSHDVPLVSEGIAIALHCHRVCYRRGQVNQVRGLLRVNQPSKSQISRVSSF